LKRSVALVEVPLRAAGARELCTNVILSGAKRRLFVKQAEKAGLSSTMLVRLIKIRGTS
jgi:hypothetical protein